MLDDLASLPLLREIGRPIQVGSVALGLMVARDIDLTILCPVLDATRVFDAIRPLAAHPRVRELRFRNDAGLWNVDADDPDGVYWGRPRYRSEAGDDWKLDLWIIQEESRQHAGSVPLAHRRLLLGRAHEGLCWFNTSLSFALACSKASSAIGRSTTREEPSVPTTFKAAARVAVRAARRRRSTRTRSRTA